MPPDATVETAKGQDDHITATLLLGPRAKLPVWVAHHPFFFSFTIYLSYLPTRVIVSHPVLSCHLNASVFDKNRFISAVTFIAALFSFTTTHGFLFPRGHKLKKRETIKEYLDVTHISL